MLAGSAQVQCSFFTLHIDKQCMNTDSAGTFESQSGFSP